VPSCAEACYDVLCCAVLCRLTPSPSARLSLLRVMPTTYPATSEATGLQSSQSRHSESNVRLAQHTICCRHLAMASVARLNSSDSTACCFHACRLVTHMPAASDLASFLHLLVSTCVPPSYTYACTDVPSCLKERTAQLRHPGIVLLLQRPSGISCMPCSTTL